MILESVELRTRIRSEGEKGEKGEKGEEISRLESEHG